MLTKASDLLTKRSLPETLNHLNPYNLIAPNPKPEILTKELDLLTEPKQGLKPGHLLGPRTYISSVFLFLERTQP